MLYLLVFEFIACSGAEFELFTLHYIIIESVDSVSRHGTDMQSILYVIHYKYPNISKQVTL